mmetsp:Transcript_13705/g.34465  ORF Transcript_13705/g.34465 Transcript_13705/m.34465 type:complete len:269 (-) Transcript_13705:43-849(-)
MRHYVFGYGSLICSESRATTAAALGVSDSSGIPVRLKNWVRLWNVQGPNTYLGVQPCKGKSCVGVLFAIPSTEDNDEVLEALDKRERGYTREEIDLELIQRVDDLLDEESSSSYYNNTFLDSTCAEKVCLWIYNPIPKYTSMATAEVPILQSYVDICMKGCLSISNKFAEEFVTGTYGWYPGDVRRLKPDIETQDDPNSSCWIDDRRHPVYIRADKEYALQHANALDAAFDKIQLDRRREISWSQVVLAHARKVVFRAYVFLKSKKVC